MTCRIECLKVRVSAQHGPEERLIATHELVETPQRRAFRHVPREPQHTLDVEGLPLEAGAEDVPLGDHMVGVVLKKRQARVDRMREADIVVSDHGHVRRRDRSRNGRDLLARRCRNVESAVFDQPTASSQQFGIRLFARIRDDDAMPELCSAQKLNLRPTQCRPVERRQDDREIRRRERGRRLLLGEVEVDLQDIAGDVAISRPPLQSAGQSLRMGEKPLLDRVAPMVASDEVLRSERRSIGFIQAVGRRVVVHVGFARIVDDLDAARTRRTSVESCRSRYWRSACVGISPVRTPM